jgi:hypothetical protein
VDCEAIRFSRHAIERMFKREIPPDVVRRVVVQGEVVADYPEDIPYPSVLMLGFQASRFMSLWRVMRNPASAISSRSTNQTLGYGWPISRRGGSYEVCNLQNR